MSNNFTLLGKGGEKNDCLFSLPDRAIGIGTDPNNCSIIYSQGKSGISAFHCQLVPKGNGWTLTDYSEKGTWLNGKKMNPYQAYSLKSGDVFYLSSLENSFYFSADSNQGQVQNPNQWQNPNQGQVQNPNQWQNPNQGQVQNPNQWQNPNPNQVNPPQSKLLEIKQKFFNWEGRLNRKPYIQRWLIVLILQVIINNIVTNVLGDPEYLLEGLIKPGMTRDEIATVTVEAYLGLIPIFILISLPLTFSFYTLAIRRLHDLNKSGWWTSMYIVFGVLCYYVSYEMIEKRLHNLPLDNKTTMGLLIIVTGILFVVCLVFSLYLLFKKGTTGPNRYGSDPLA